LSNPRGNIGHLLVAGGGVLTIIFLLLPWFGGQRTDETAHAMETFELFDLIVILLTLASIVIALGVVTGRTANTPLDRPKLLVPLTGAVVLILLTLAIEFAWAFDQALALKWGGYLNLLAALAMLAGAVLTNRPELAARVESRVESAAQSVGSSGGPGQQQPGQHQPGAVGSGAPAGGTPGGTPLGGPQSPGGFPGGAPSPGGVPGGVTSPGPSSPAPASPAPAPAPASPAPTPSPTPEPVQQDPSAPAAGWYPDPQGQKRLRYWDGGRWTEQTAD
jgi:hypothetical protein